MTWSCFVFVFFKRGRNLFFWNDKLLKVALTFRLCIGQSVLFNFFYLRMEFTVLPQLYTRERQQVKNSRLLKVNSPTKPLVQSSFQASDFTGDEQDSAGTANSQEAGALGLCRQSAFLKFGNLFSFKTGIFPLLLICHTQGSNWNSKETCLIRADSINLELF